MKKMKKEKQKLKSENEELKYIYKNENIIN
jgi:hypothetical protein